MKHILTLLLLCFANTIVKAQKKVGRPMVSFHVQNREHNNAGIPKYMPLGNTKWKFKTGGKVFSSPAVINGIVLIGSEDKNLYAIDIKTGTQKWKFTTGGPVYSSPAVYDNTIYFGSCDGYYYALYFTTGKQKWKFKTGGEKQNGDTSYWGMKPAGMYMEDLWDFFLSSPIVDKSGEDVNVYFGSSDGNLYAVNAKDGSVKWAFNTKGSIHSSPTLYNGIIYIGSWNTYLYAINAKTGKEQWKFKTGEQVAMAGILASATVENGVVYFGARDAHLYALKADNGSLLWTYDAQGSWIISSAAVDEKMLYVGTSDSYLLLALDTETGKEKYRVKTNGYVFGSPAIVAGTAYFGDFTGKMYALDLASMGKRWNSFSTAARNKNAISVLKNDTLNFTYSAKGDDLSFYAVNKKIMDDFFQLGSIVSSPAVKDGVIYFGSADGYLYALNLKK